MILAVIYSPLLATQRSGCTTGRWTAYGHCGTCIHPSRTLFTRDTLRKEENSRLTRAQNRQTRDPSTRYTQLDNGTYGHITWANSPASRLTELDDIIDMGYAGPSVRIRDVMSTTSGPLCYFYEESP